MGSRVNPKVQQANRSGPGSRWTGYGTIEPGAGVHNNPKDMADRFIQKVGDGLKNASRRFSRLGKMPKNPLSK